MLLHTSSALFANPNISLLFATSADHPFSIALIISYLPSHLKLIMTDPSYPSSLIKYLEASNQAPVTAPIIFLSIF